MFLLKKETPPGFIIVQLKEIHINMKVIFQVLEQNTNGITSIYINLAEMWIKPRALHCAKLTLYH